MSFRYIYRCERCGVLRFKDATKNFCRCGGRYKLIYDDADRAKYPDVKVENDIAYFKVRCAFGHWHFAPYIGGRISYDFCPECEDESGVALTPDDVKDF